MLFLKYNGWKLVHSICEIKEALKRPRASEAELLPGNLSHWDEERKTEGSLMWTGEVSFASDKDCYARLGMTTVMSG